MKVPKIVLCIWFLLNIFHIVSNQNYDVSSTNISETSTISIFILYDHIDLYLQTTKITGG